MRVLRVVVIIGVVLGGLFAGLDRWAAGYAEDRIAERIQARQGLSGVEVDIQGFPFLTQALSRDLDEVDLKVAGADVATAEGRTTHVSRLRVAFSGVELNGDYSGGTARSAKGSALVTYADLTAAAQPGVTVAYGGAPGKVKVTARVEFLGRTLSRSVVSTVSLVDAGGGKGGKTVRVRADEVPGEGLPGIETVVRRKTDFDRRIDEGLPSGVQLTALTSDASGVMLTLGGRNLALAG
ncbi:LmeA family phospholipid-binding protein [Streptomyces sp. NPDC002104]